MITLKPFPAFLGLVFLFVFARPALAFGAGNIAGMLYLLVNNDVAQTSR